MLYALSGFSLENNSQLEPVVITLAVIVVIGAIIAINILSVRDKRKEKYNENLDAERQGEKVVDRLEFRSKKPSDEKVIRQVKRESRDPKKRAEIEAAAKNTLLGGKSEAQMEEKEAGEVFGSLGISSKKAEEIDKAKEQIIINGYLQKSNTAPIRPVYSNTLEARQQQRRELDSDTFGKEAETPALVMDSAAPSNVRITDAPVQKVKPTALKRPTAARASQTDEMPAEENKEIDTTYIAAIRPETGSEVSNAVADVVAEVQEEKPEILRSGEEAIIPAAKKTVKGFVPDKKVLARNSREED